MTVDYDGEQAVPEPVSAVIAKFLRRSFSVADVFRRAMRGWLFGIIGLAFGLIFGVYTAWTTPPSYTVTIGLLPTDSGGGDILSGDSAGGALGALAGLIGISGQPVPKFTRFVASLYASGVTTTWYAALFGATAISKPIPGANTPASTPGLRAG